MEVWHGDQKFRSLSILFRADGGRCLGHQINSHGQPCEYSAPNDTYTNESIITYTEIFNSIADAFEAAKK